MTATIPGAVTVARDLVSPALQSAVDRLAPTMRRVAGYHFGWLDQDGRATDSGGGKALRPALAVLSARAAGAPVDRGVPAAVAVELVHNFSLLHDDIMDGDRERRHRPTAWTVFGPSAAILAGDALLTLAHEVLLEEGSQGSYWSARCLSAATQRLIAGQTADLEFEDRVDVTLEECTAMASDKTAALLACSCSIGAMLTGAPANLAAGLAEFGAHLGMAFQVVDDLLGIWGAPEITGKPVLSDLRTRKKSLPVVAALTAGTAASARLSELLHRAERLEENELHDAAALVEKAGGRSWAEAEAGRQLADAEKCLDELDMPDEVRQEFLHIARYVTSRDR